MTTQTCSYITGRILAVMEAIQLDAPGENQQHHVTIFTKQLKSISAQPHLYLLGSLRKVVETYLPLIPDDHIDFYQDRLTELVSRLDSFSDDERRRRLAPEYVAGYYAEQKNIKEALTNEEDHQG